MLHIQAHLIAAAARATHPAELHDLLQGAIELEHSTIPPYMTALLSLKPGGNAAARGILASVMMQEMLHMAIAANLLNAIGGTPCIDRPGFIPTYPGTLPMSVDDGLTVGLRKLTRDLVVDCFMRIEQPEKPLDISVGGAPPASANLAATALSQTYGTIGAFYRTIRAKLEEFGPSAFLHPSHPQVVPGGWFPASQLFPITDLPSALRAIDIIIDQGEGTRRDPFEPGSSDEPAHYYRFAEILNARRLVADSSRNPPYAYSGGEVALDPAQVWNLYPDPKAADYVPGSRERQLVERFNQSYTALLRALEETFNGAPDEFSAAIGLMNELRLLGLDVVATPVSGTAYQATPSFEYTPLLT